MSWFTWIAVAADAVMAIVAILKWKHAATAGKIADVLIGTIETATPTEAAHLKRDAERHSRHSGVGTALYRRVVAMGFSGKAA